MTGVRPPETCAQRPVLEPRTPASELPQHDEFTLWRRLFEAGCLSTVGVLLVWQVYRLAGLPRWYLAILLPAACAGALAADFVSGLVHWTADTWGRETMPLLGRRFLRPFRVHHVNPDDFLRRRFLDVNGDVALIVIPFVASIFLLPLDSAPGQGLAAFVLSFCVVGLPTNQVHQWAHMPCPPPWVQWLQRRRIILSREDHLVHHCSPFASHYCIATGWCNRWLDRWHFFRRAERCVTACTGLRPRDDDSAFHASVFVPPLRESQP